MENINETSTKLQPLQEVKIDTRIIEPASWKPPFNIECPCCLEVPKQARIILNCRHLMCIECFMTHTLRSNNCPVCRVKITDVPEGERQLPRPQLIRHSANSFVSREINRRLRHHIEEIESITEQHATVRETFNQLRRHIANQSPGSQSHPRPRTRRHLRDAPPLSNGRYNTESSRNNNTTEMTSRQYITVAIITLVDIFIMILWLYMINNNHS